MGVDGTQDITKVGKMYVANASGISVTIDGLSITLPNSNWGFNRLILLDPNLSYSVSYS